MGGMGDNTRDWGRVAILVAALAIGIAIGALVTRSSGGISQECFAALQLRLAETPTEIREPIPDSELDRVCPGWTRLNVGSPR